MSEIQVEVQGTLESDGTLRLDKKPALPPGRVTVLLRPAAPALPPGAPTDWFEYMQWARKQLEDSGHHFMGEEEMAAWIRELRGEDDEDAHERAARGE